MKPDWLQQLAPAHAPAAAGWWPLAPGWWIVLAVLLVGLGWLIYRYRRRASRLRRTALRELAHLQAGQNDDKQLATELERLMRRYAIAIHGRETVAHLSGEAWLGFVIQHGGTAFAGEVGHSLLRTAYGSTVQPERSLWLQGARDFLRHSR